MTSAPSDEGYPVMLEPGERVVQRVDRLERLPPRHREEAPLIPRPKDCGRYAAYMALVENALCNPWNEVLQHQLQRWEGRHLYTHVSFNGYRSDYFADGHGGTAVVGTPAPTPTVDDLIEQPDTTSREQFPIVEESTRPTPKRNRDLREVEGMLPDNPRAIAQRLDAGLPVDAGPLPVWAYLTRIFGIVLVALAVIDPSHAEVAMLGAFLYGFDLVARPRS